MFLRSLDDIARIMETRYLKTLVTAVEEGSFSRAAEVLHITQSAVSHPDHGAANLFHGSS